MPQRMSDAKVQKLEQFGYTLPLNLEQQIQQRAQQIIKQIAAQYDQSKEVLWACLEQQDGQTATQKLSPNDAYQAITSEIHGLLIFGSQMYRLFLNEMLEEKELTNTLREQLKQARPPENATMFVSQADQLKSVYSSEVENLKKQVEMLKKKNQGQEDLIVKLEKQNISLKSGMQYKEIGVFDLETQQEIPANQSDNISKRLIYQREMLQLAIDQLKEEQGVLQSQNQSISQIMSLQKSQLISSTGDKSLLDHLYLQQQYSQEQGKKIETLKLEIVELKTQLEEAKMQLESQSKFWDDERRRLKQGWQSVFDEVCANLGVQL